MRVLIAPDCYGDSLTAVEAAEAIARGWRSGRPDDELALAPQSDGGPGFVGVLAGRIGEVNTLRVSGPRTEDVSADWVLDPAAPRTAYIECAQACGLALLGGPPTAQTALAAHSRGGVELIAATDVEHPLLGPMGAAAVFGPQKGADPDTVRVLEQRLSDWAVELNAAAGRAVSDEAGAGAAGGIGAALLALGARRESGAAIIAEHTRLADDVVVTEPVTTGEGRFDDQSLHGKVVSALAAGARSHRIPVLVLAGQVTLDEATLADAGIAAAFSITDHAGSVQRAIEDAANLTAATWG